MYTVAKRMYYCKYVQYVVRSSCWFPYLFVDCILQMDVFDAAERYRQEGRQLIILAGKDYGSGSSRDWAAKGPWMQVLEIRGQAETLNKSPGFVPSCTS